MKKENLSSLINGVATWNGDPFNINDYPEELENILESIKEFGAEKSTDPTDAERLGISDPENWEFFTSGKWGEKVTFAVPK